MLLRSQNDKFYLQFRALNDVEGLRHGIFTRLGGNSRGAFQGFNLARSVGDETRAVTANRTALARLFAPGTLFFAHQTHGTDVHVLDGRPPPSTQTSIDTVASSDAETASQAGGDTDTPPKADALISDRPGIFAAIQVADCQAVLLVDPRRRVVANIHSGWRGSCANIIARTIAILEKRCGCKRSDLLAAIGPSLGPCCGEFRHYRENLPREVWAYGNDAAHFNFWTLSRDQLIAAGVPTSRIYQSRICTRCNTDLFFSYRASHDTGRFAAVIGFEGH